MTDTPSTLEIDQGNLAYHHSPGSAPGALFCGGYMSDMEGSKALALEAHCTAAGRAFTRFDYRGHGQSSGAFRDLVISDWLNDALAIFDQVTTGPQIVIGSSMGGWIALHLALARAQRVKAMILIAPAPDFTSRLMWPSFTQAEKAQMEAQGYIEQPTDYGPEPYVITKSLIEDGKSLGLLHAPIPIHCPVRILHGQRDTSVPWDLSLELMDRLESEDVIASFIKQGDHRLSEPDDITRLLQMLDSLA